MLAVISKIGDSQGILLDQTLMEHLHLRAGDLVNIEVHDGGVATLTPLHASPSSQDVSATIASVVNDFAKTLNRLA